MDTAHSQDLEWVGFAKDSVIGFHRVDVIKTAENQDVLFSGTFRDTLHFDFSNTSSIQKESRGFYLTRTDSSGNIIWIKTFECVSADCQGWSKIEDFEVLQNGNIVVSGYFDDSLDFDPGIGTNIKFDNTAGLTTNSFSMMLDGAGNLLWINAYTDGGTSSNTKIEVTSNNTILIAGTYTGYMQFDPNSSSSISTGGGRSVFVLAIDMQGNFLWVNQVKSLTQQSFLSLSDFVVSEQNELILGINFSGVAEIQTNQISTHYAQSGIDFLIVKLDSLWSELWTYTSINSDNTNVATLTVDDNGEIYAAGQYTGHIDLGLGPNGNNSYSPPPFNTAHLFFLKLSPMGETVWSYNCVGNGISEPLSISVGPNGFIHYGLFYNGQQSFLFTNNSYFTTQFSGTSGNFAMIKSNKNGEFVSGLSFVSPETEILDEFYIDNRNNIYISGLYNDGLEFNPRHSNGFHTALNHDAFVAKYSQSMNCEIEVLNNPCIDEANGEIQVIVLDPALSGPYSYIITNQIDSFIGTSTLDTFIVTGLAAGNYSIQISNSFGYIFQDLFEIVHIGDSSGLSLNDVCISDSPFHLTGGIPIGGTYQINGISQAFFNPSLLGVGTHNIVYITSDSLCSDTLYDQIQVYDHTNLQINNPDTICINASEILLNYATPAGGNYYLSNSNINSLVPLNHGVGEHLLTYEFINLGGCIDSITSGFFITDTAAITLNVRDSICVGDNPIILNDVIPTGGIFFGADVNQHVFTPNPSNIGAQLINYQYINSGDCLSSSFETIHVLDYHYDTIEIELCPGDTYLLSNGDSLNYSNEQYEIIMDNFNDCDSLLIYNIVKSPNCNVACQFILPTAFSPNDDGINDYLKWFIDCQTEVDEFSFKVFNRYGELIYVTSNIHLYWDGMYKERKSELGIYVYVIEFNTLESQTKITSKGNFTLIR